MKKIEEKLKTHPCFNKEAKGQYGRVHLPVAPKCNIQCGYCNRKYDCVNESRPGVTSAVLSPYQSVAYLDDLFKKLPNISVVGIAGPGDPFANPDETMETLRLIHEKFPDKLLCLSSNGLNLYSYLDEIATLNVSHITVTVNSLKPETLAKIYPWIRFNKKVYRGIEGGKVILEQQLKSLQKIKELGIIAKVNTIVLPGINDNDIEDVAKKAAEIGVDLMNCIPLFPAEDTLFEDMEEPSSAYMKEIRKKVEKYLKPMTHCARCRADAAGLLGKDSEIASCKLKEFAQMPEKPSEDRPYVAVASNEGLLVNQHLGEAAKLFIYKETKNGYRLVDQRVTPEPGCGNVRWLKLADILNDCRAIMVSGIGPNPTHVLKSSGVRVIQMTGLIDTGLDTVFKGTVLRTLNKAESFKCGESCKGDAQGCA